MESTLLHWLAEIGLPASTLLQLLFGLMIGILFLQSGLDKIFNYKGERDFYQQHFKGSLLAGTVPLLMPMITILENGAGFLTIIGLVLFLFNGNPDIVLLGLLFANLSILSLFLGQRVAKDYNGAATLVPYFLLTAAGFYVFVFIQ